MMTLKELQNKIERTTDKVLPTAAKLRSGSFPLAACRAFDDGAQLSVYQNGFALYQSFGKSTVFRVDTCGGYTYFGIKTHTELDEAYFQHAEWWIRLMMEGEDRLTHNQNVLIERHECLYEVSPDTACSTEDFLEDRILRETLDAVFACMTNRQREIVVMYHIEGKSLKEIAAVYGITHQAVSVTLSDVKKKLQKNRGKFYGNI